jgi:hypothetical protein
MAAEEENTGRAHGSGGVAAPEAAGGPIDGDERKKKDDGDIEYEVEFATPFGKLEFEFEPLAKKERKDRERKDKAERDAGKKAREAAEKALARAGREGGGGLLSRLFVVVLVLGIIAALIGIAYWLFARPGEEDEVDAVPDDVAGEPAPARQGFAAKARGRVTDAISAGRGASREAQREQREKFRQAAGGR